MLFLNSVSSAAALVFYLPCVCTHTDTEGEQRKARVRNILKSAEKNTIINEHPVPGVVFVLILLEGGGLHCTYVNLDIANTSRQKKLLEKGWLV